MNKVSQARVVLVTCGTLTEGRRIALKVLKKRLVACVNIVLSPVVSFYIWKGKIERAREYLLVIKTTAKRLADLQREVERLHSYEVPEFLVLPVSSGSPHYLSWLTESTKGN